MKYERLFTPITINGMELKNRLMMPALHHLYTPEGYATERFNRYYWRRAEGGVGLIITGGCRFDDYGGSYAMMNLQRDEFIPSYKEFTDGVHERGAKVGVQLYHAGRYASSKFNPDNKQPIAPSAVFSTFSREMPREMTKADIDEVIKNWADGAVRAQQAGFDIVEILGSAGYLISQFLSPTTNQRTDEYGGSWENRTRFPLEVIAAVRKAVGPDYPLMMRIAGNDFVPGANTNENAVEFAKLAEAAGIDVLDVTGGWHETRVPQLPGELPRGGFTYLASAVKKAVSIPVVACNRINRPWVAERVLALGQGDMIGISRPLVADPDWPKKAMEEREDEIRGCVACNQGCLAKTFFGQSVECLVNGEAGREYIMEDKKPATLKKMLVVGAGPGGCEFALKAAELGHTVTLWEKDDKLGGQLNIVYAPPGKREFATLITYYETMLRKRGVKVELGKEATVEAIAAGGFDEVVIASGVVPNSIPLPKKNDDIPVYYAVDVLEGKVFPGKNVVIVGGGSVGCEAAQYLIHEGSVDADQVYFLMHQKAETVEKIEELMISSDRAVSIVEIAPKIGAGFDPGTGWPVLDDLKRMGVGMYAGAKIQEIGSDAVAIEVTDKEGNVKNVSIPCDAVVLAVGSRPNTALYEAVKDKVSNVHLLGDAAGVGKVIDAIRQADDLAVNL